jgi:hypothetical protein
MADGAIFGGKVEMPQIKAASGPRPVEAPAAVAV